MRNHETLANKLKMLGHPIRLQILQMLRHGETCVCHLEHAIGRRQAYVSQQLMALRDAGLVECRKVGQQVYYRLADDELESLLDFLYGSEVDTTLETLLDCPCPSCSSLVENKH